MIPAVKVKESQRTGLYVHLPFCLRRCTYCAFAISTNANLEIPYMEALAHEVRHRGEAWGPSLSTIYLGGGTPSRSSFSALKNLFSGIRDRFDTRSVFEVTLEANPEDVDPAAVEIWSGLGVDRISLGVQSFHDDELETIGRSHGRNGALRAISILQRAQIDFSLDLIAGLPHQTSRSFRESLEFVVEASPRHVSVYMLDLEPGSPLEKLVEKKRVDIPADSIVAEMYREAVATLEANGIHQYEVSNFAQDGFRAIHNSSYWDGAPYLGVGLSAHSFDGEMRYANHRNMRRYIELATRSGDPVESSEKLDQNLRREEKLLLNLRRTEGITSDELDRLAGKKGEEWLDRGREQGWIRQDRIALTTEGFLLSNSLIGELF